MPPLQPRDTLSAAKESQKTIPKKGDTNGTDQETVEVAWNR